MKRAFICMHESEAGFPDSKAAMDWLDHVHSEDRDKWRVVEISVDPVTEALIDAERAELIDAAFLRGIEHARKLLRFRLGLAVLED